MNDVYAKNANDLFASWYSQIGDRTGLVIGDWFRLLGAMDYFGHQYGLLINVDGRKGQYELIWSKVTQRMRNFRSDMGYTVESGAYCLAM